jgi:hypothetical protein
LKDRPRPSEQGSIRRQAQSAASSPAAHLVHEQSRQWGLCACVLLLAPLPGDRAARRPTRASGPRCSPGMPTHAAAFKCPGRKAQACSRRGSHCRRSLLAKRLTHPRTNKFTPRPRLALLSVSPCSPDLSDFERAIVFRWRKFYMFTALVCRCVDALESCLSFYDCFAISPTQFCWCELNHDYSRCARRPRVG